MPDTERVSVRQLTRAFNGLFSLVESADLAPTPDALTAISKYEQAARTTLAEWKQFVSSELPQINTVLKEAGLGALPETDCGGGAGPSKAASRIEHPLSALSESVCAGGQLFDRGSA